MLTFGDSQYLAPRDPKDTLVMEPIEVDDPNTALDDLRNILARSLEVLFKTPPEQLGLAGSKGSSDPPSRICDWARQGGRGEWCSNLVSEHPPDVVVLCLQPRYPVRVEDVLAELLQVELLRLAPIHFRFLDRPVPLPLLPARLLLHKVSGGIVVRRAHHVVQALLGRLKRLPDFLGLRS